ncbi:MAG TPA: RHS repeat protein [Gammaproteobacteria bacterium]|nr:RHS repeat protein [Gammaproteobacteria bacterium]
MHQYADKQRHSQVHGLLLILACLFVMLPPAPAWGYDAPWDQGHQTTDDDDPEPPGPPDGPDCGNTNNSPVHISSGDLVWRETDIAIPGRVPLTLTRSYHSHDPRDGMFGKGWTVSCEASLIKVTGGSSLLQVTEAEKDGNLSVSGPVVQIAYVLREAGGRRHAYTLEPDGNIKAPKWRLDRIEEQSDGTVKLIEQDGSYRLFNANGLLIKKVDRNGNSLFYTRDSTGRLTQMADEHGRYLDFTYDSTGHVVSVTDHTGRAWQYSYNSDGALTSLTDPAGGVRRYTWQAAELVDYSLLAQAGSSSRASGAPASAPPPFGTMHTYQQLTSVTDASGVTVLNVTYETINIPGSVTGVPAEKTAPGRRVKSYTEGSNTWTYNVTQRRSRKTVTKTDTAGSVNTYTISRRDGQLSQKRDPLGNTERWQYDGTNQISRYTDPTGGIWQYSRDALGRLQSSSDPLGNTTTYTYKDNQPWPVKITSPSGRITSIDYDGKGNPISITDPSNAVTKIEYNPQGDLTAIIDAAGHRTEISYNAAGLPVSRKDPLGRVTQLAYDALGRLTGITNAAGEVSQIAYDALGRIISATDGLGQSTQYSYDPAGRLLKITDARANPIGEYTYDAYGRLQSATEAGITTNYTYNADNTIASTDRGGIVHAHTYDRAKRRTGTSNPDLGITYAHDKAGRLTRVQDNLGTVVSYRYDAAGRFIREQNGITSISLSYNQDNELTAWRNIQLERDARGLLQKLTTADGAQYTYQYDPRGLLQQIQTPAGAWQYTHDAAGQITGQDYSQTGGSAYSYTYDPAGRLVQASGEQLRTYGYDAASQLTSASHGASGYIYQYDPVGNRLEQQQRYDANNRLLEDPRHTYEYDTTGRLTRKTDKTTGAHTDYTWDSLDRLTVLKHYPDANTATATTEASYQYDALGRRIRKTVNGQVTSYQWAGTRLVSESSNNQAREYLYDGTGYTPIAIVEGGNTWYIHRDHLGTPRSVSDSSGRIVWQNLPSPYGISQVDEDPDGDGVAFTLNIRFPGQYYDSESGLHYNYFRYYDPSTGRYITSDPIGLQGGLNTYAYAENNPVVFSDPFGLKTLMCTKPLDAMGGDGTRSGPDIWGNPLYHQYICVKNGKTTVCGGQDRKDGPWGPGKPSNDKYDPKRCEEEEPDNACIETCLISEFGKPRPYYGLFGPGTNCQEWADDTLSKCRKQCKKP